jgi:hypothetical protein
METRSPSVNNYVTPLGQKYNVSFADYPKDYRQDAKVLFDAIRDDLTGQDGKLLCEKDLEFGTEKVPGREVHVDTGKEHIRDRLFWRGNRLYHVIVAGPETFIRGEEAQAFLDSFEMAE